MFSLQELKHVEPRLLNALVGFTLNLNLLEYEPPGRIVPSLLARSVGSPANKYHSLQWVFSVHMAVVGGHGWLIDFVSV